MKHLVNVLQTTIKAGIVLPKDEVLNIVLSSNYDYEVCKLAFPLLNDRGLFESMIPHLSKSKDNRPCLGLLLSHLSLEERNENELFAYIESGKSEETICNAILPFINLKDKKRDELVSILAKLQYTHNACEPILPLLNPSKQKEAWLWELVVNSRYNWTICRYLIGYLSRDHIFEILKMYQYREKLCALAVPHLKKVDDIVYVITRSEYEENVCKVGIPLLKTEKTKMKLFRDSDYRTSVSLYVIPTLKQKANIMLVMEICKKNSYLCEVLFPLCKDEKDIMEMLKIHSYLVSLCQSALPFLKNEDNILLVARDHIYDKDKKEIGFNNLHLEKKSEPQLWDLMDKMKYDYRFCCLALKHLNLKKKSEPDILQLLRQHNRQDGFCGAISAYIKKEETLINIFRDVADEAKPGIIARLSKESKEKLFRSLHNEDDMKLLVYRVSQEALLEKLKKNYASKSLCNIISAALTRSKLPKK
ncbi:MAG: hypothetical protein NT085_04695 [candidate division SR1 bacterium]|nr:hypothetical protein [candidate division SR1 bacterium]